MYTQEAKMITCHRQFLEERCRERGYTLDQVMGCVLLRDGDLWTVDELHPLYPHKLDAGGPGTELSKILGMLGLHALEGCKCKKRAQVMDEWGPDACEQNIDLIVSWLEDEAKGRKLPFIRWGAKTLVKVAIRRARKHKTQPSGT
jgi:hypothetical protein